MRTDDDVDAVELQEADLLDRAHQARAVRAAVSEALRRDRDAARLSERQRIRAVDLRSGGQGWVQG